jgi:tetratricopeptide (TPR) repeat protein
VISHVSKGSLLRAAALVVATFVCYFPALRGEFIWDDDRHVSDNRMLRSARGLRRIWFEPGVTPQYYPMTHTSFWLEYRLWKLDPTGYHVTNVLLHAVNALLLWRLLARLEVPGSFLAAAVFALHPVNVESVAWISERKNVLASSFFLFSLGTYVTSGEVSATEPGRRFACFSSLRFAPAWWNASFVLFLCALFSKTITCSLPAVVILILWWKRKLTAREVVKLVPFFVVGIAMGLVTARMEHSYVGASGSDWDISFAARCIIAARAVWFYVGKLLVPARLTFSYPRWEIDARDPLAWVRVVALLSAIVLLFVLQNRKRIGRAPIAAVLIFIGTLVPALGFINTYPMRYSFVADHFAYLSSAAMIALVIATLLRLKTPRAALVLVLPILGFLTWSRAHVYANAESIWRDTIAKNPSSWMARHNLGVTLSAQADEDLRAGRSDTAHAKLNEALKLFDEVERLRPGHEKLWANRADALQKLGRYNAALAIYRERLRNDPNNARLLEQVGMVLNEMGRHGEALEHFRGAVALDPNASESHVNLARALEAQGRYDEAMAVYDAAIARLPNDPLLRLAYGTLLYRHEVNRLHDAAAQFEAYLKLRPDDADAHATAGFIYGELGQYDDAKREFRSALKIDPSHVNAMRGMNLLRSH